MPACSRNKAPDSLFDAAGYHARGDKVYYLSAFPGKASEIAGADATSFKAFDTTYAKDKSNAYFDGHPIPVADATTFAVSFRALDGPYAGDTRRMYWMGKAIDGADPATFRVLNAAFECSADAARVLSAIRHRRTFPPGRAVTNCTDTSISFAE